jgi:hypothetical protein
MTSADVEGTKMEESLSLEDSSSYTPLARSALGLLRQNSSTPNLSVAVPQQTHLAMKRDYPIIEQILEALDDCEREWEFNEALKPITRREGYEKVKHQLKILLDAGVIRATAHYDDAELFGSESIHGSAKGRLTWTGHELLQAIRDGQDYQTAVETVRNA